MELSDGEQALAERMDAAQAAIQAPALADYLKTGIGDRGKCAKTQRTERIYAPVPILRLECARKVRDLAGEILCEKRDMGRFTSPHKAEFDDAADNLVCYGAPFWRFYDRRRKKHAPLLSAIYAKLGGCLSRRRSCFSRYSAASRGANSSFGRMRKILSARNWPPRS